MHNGWTSCDSADLNPPATMISVIVTSLQPHTFFFPQIVRFCLNIFCRDVIEKNMYYQHTINVSSIFITCHYILYSNHITLVMVHISSNDSLYHFTNFTSQKPQQNPSRIAASKFSPGWTIILSPRIQRIQGFLAMDGEHHIFRHTK